MNKINFTNLPSTTTPLNATNMNAIQDNVDNAKVEKSGDTMTGILTFNNTNEYGAVYKHRTVNNIDYEGSFGIGIDSNGNGATVFESYKGSNRVGRIELREDNSIVNGMTGKKLVEESIQEGTLVDTSNYFSSIDIHRVIKQGKVAQIAFRGQLSKNITSSDKILKCSYVPFYGSNGAGAVYLGNRYSTDNLAWFYMDGSGYIQGITATSGKYIHINYTYIMS